MGYDVQKMLSQDPSTMADEQIKAANTIALAQSSGKSPVDVDYEAESKIYFGEEKAPSAQYADFQSMQDMAPRSEVTTNIIEFNPEWGPNPWNDAVDHHVSGAEMFARVGDSIELGEKKAKRFLTMAMDIVPSMIRGVGMLGEQIYEAGEFGDYKSLQLVSDMIDETPHLQAMLKTPREFIDESGKIKEDARQDLKTEMKNYGIVAQAVDDITDGVVETMMHIQSMRMMGMTIGGTPSKAQAAQMSQQMISRLQAAGQLGLFKGITAEAKTMKERADIAGITFLYMSTPAASGAFADARNVFISDLMLNSAITAPQVLELWESGEDDYTKIVETIKMIGADVVFSSMTKTMRSNRMNPNWKPMKEAADRLVKSGDNMFVIPNLDAALADYRANNEWLNTPPKTSNPVKEAQVKFEEDKKGAINIDREKAQSEADLKEIEKVVTERASAEEAKPAEKAQPDPKVVSPEKVPSAQREGVTDAQGMTKEQATEIKQVLDETRDLPVEDRVEAVTKAMEDVSQGRPVRKTSKVKQAIEKATGVKRAPDNIVVSGYQMLKKQLRDLNRGLKEGKKLGKAEAKQAQREYNEKLANLHSEASDYVRQIVRKDKPTLDKLRAMIPKIKTVEGLDKFQKEVNRVVSDNANKKARVGAKDALRKLRKVKLGGDEKKRADELFSKFDSRGTSDEKLTELQTLYQASQLAGMEMPKDIRKKMDSLKKIQLRNMNTQDLLDLKDVADSIRKGQKLKEAATKLGQQKHIEKTANDFMAQRKMVNFSGTDMVDDKGDRPKVQHNLFSRGLGAKRRLDLTPHALTYLMDGAREGTLHDLFVRQSWDGDTVRYQLEREAHQEMAGFRDRILNWGEATAKDGFRTTMGEKAVTLSIGEKLNIYLDSMNEGNTRHALEGGYELKQFHGQVIKPTPDEFFAIADSVAKNLPELEVALTIARGYDNILKPAMNEVSNRMHGYDIARVENYNPISSVTKAGEAEVLPSSMLDLHQALIDSSPHFKSRSGGRNPIKLNNAIDKYDNMVKLISRYKGFAEVVRDQKQFMDGFSTDGKSVRAAIDGVYGPEYRKALETLTKDLEAGGQKQIADAWKKWNTFVLGTGRGYLAFNPSVAVGQPVSYMTALNEIPAKYWIKGNYFNPTRSWDEMGEHSALLWSRGKGHLDIAFGELAEAKRMQKRYKMIRFQDQKAISMIVDSATAWSKAELGRTDYKDIYEKVDRIVRTTQPTFEAIDRPELARDPHFRTLTMFSSVINKNHALRVQNDMKALQQIQDKEFGAKEFNDWAKKTVLNRVLTPTTFAFIKTITNPKIMGAVALGAAGKKEWDEIGEEALTKMANKLTDASIGETGLLLSQFGNALKYALSRYSDKVSGFDKSTPGFSEIASLSEDTIALSNLLLEADKDKYTPEWIKRQDENPEKVRKIISRMARNTMALTQTGAQNVWDLLKVPGGLLFEEEKDFEKLEEY